MKRILCFLLCVLMVAMLAVPVLAAPIGPTITFNPQSPVWMEYSVASYRVQASGSNLTATWYMEWQGVTYNLSDNTNATEPWEGYAGESYGGMQEDANTFVYFFSGIEASLDGAYIWCVVEDGHNDVASYKARVLVSGSATPPTIESMPTQLTVTQGDSAEVRCIALAPGSSQLSFTWYETSTGRLEDMQAVNRGAETSDYMFCDTSQVGTRLYLCMVESSDGGKTYSSIVNVTVDEKAYFPEPPSIQTNVLPEGVAGSNYYAKLSCTDPSAEFSLYYSPGGRNEFSELGMKLSANGEITGTPSAPGEYSFSVCAANAGGEDYMTYVLIINEAPAAPSATPAASPESRPADPTPAPATEAPQVSAPVKEPETPAPTQSASDTPEKESESVSFPWWALLIVAIVAAGAGVGVAMLLINKTKK